jgi:transposase
VIAVDETKLSVKKSLNWSQNYLGLFLNAICMGVREFREVSDYEWEVIRPFLPPRSSVGRPRADDRMVLNGILYVLTSGCRWCKYGSYKTAWRRLKEMGVWESIFKALASMRDLSRVSVDSTTVEAKKGER